MGDTGAFRIHVSKNGILHSVALAEKTITWPSSTSFAEEKVCTKSCFTCGVHAFSPQMVGHLYDLCTIIAPRSPFFKSKFEKVRFFFSPSSPASISMFLPLQPQVLSLFIPAVGLSADCKVKPNRSPEGDIQTAGFVVELGKGRRGGDCEGIRVERTEAQGIPSGPGCCL